MLWTALGVLVSTIAALSGAALPGSKARLGEESIQAQLVGAPVWACRALRRRTSRRTPVHLPVGLLD